MGSPDIYKPEKPSSNKCICKCVYFVWAFLILCVLGAAGFCIWYFIYGPYTWITPICPFEDRQCRVENGFIPFEWTEGSEDTNSTVDERLRHWRVNGMQIAVIHNYSIDWVQSYGLLKNNWYTTDNETLFQAGSIGAFVTALASMSLYEKGDLDLDDDISFVLANSSWNIPESNLTENASISLRQILSHTAGFNIESFPGYSFEEEIPGLVDILNGSYPANSDPVEIIEIPGTTQMYSAGGLTVEQNYLELTQNRTFDDILYQHIMDPIGMFSSSFELYNQSQYHDTLNSSLHPNTTEFVNIAPGCQCLDDEAKEIPGYWHSYPEKAAAGLWSTAQDLAKFLVEISKSSGESEDALFNKTTIDEMFSIDINATEGINFPHGLGPNVATIGGTTWFHHSGSNFGYCGMVLGNTDGDGLVILTNSDCSRSHPILGEAFRAVSSVYEWTGVNTSEAFTDYNARMFVQPALASNQEYEGVYSVPYNLTDIIGENVTEVMVWADKIRFNRTGECSYRMYPCAEEGNRDKMCTEFAYGWDRPPGYISFNSDVNGTVISMNYHLETDVLEFEKISELEDDEIRIVEM